MWWMQCHSATTRRTWHWKCPGPHAMQLWDRQHPSRYLAGSGTHQHWRTWRGILDPRISSHLHLSLLFGIHIFNFMQLNLQPIVAWHGLPLAHSLASHGQACQAPTKPRRVVSQLLRVPYLPTRRLSTHASLNCNNTDTTQPDHPYDGDIIVIIL